MCFTAHLPHSELALGRGGYASSRRDLDCALRVPLVSRHRGHTRNTEEKDIFEESNPFLSLQHIRGANRGWEGQTKEKLIIVLSALAKSNNLFLSKEICILDLLMYSSIHRSIKFSITITNQDRIRCS